MAAAALIHSQRPANPRSRGVVVPRYHAPMVRLSKIYTKVGDAGTTMLGDGKTVPKEDPRVEAYGTVDEANAALGLVVAQMTHPAEIRAELVRIQHDLFDVGADLCVPIEPGEEPGKRLRIIPEQVQRLETLIDRYNEPLAPLNSFVLPGGTALSSHLHLARTVVRRAERLVAALLHAEPRKTNAQSMIYLNRLSDLLFVLARVLNNQGKDDVLWKPGANR